MNNTNPTPDQPASRAKNKTLASCLAVLGGPLGLHRFYLYGWHDLWAWLHVIPATLGLWGFERMQQHGQDDVLSWWLLPWLGLVIAISCLSAILYALDKPEPWNRRHNPTLAAQHPSGRTTGLTVTVLVCALMLGTIALMSSLAFSFQRYFEYQVQQGLLLSQ